MDLLNATIVEKVCLTERQVRLLVRPDQPARPFQAGQYVALGLPERQEDFEQARPVKLIKRTYSIGSSELELEQLEFFFAVVPDGSLTSRLGTLNVGDRIYVAPKITGTFTLEGTPENADLVMIATGTGIAPFISMLRTPSTWTPTRRIGLIHGVRHQSELAYHVELMTLQAAKECFKYHSTVSRPSPEWGGEQGRVQRFVTEGLLKLDPMKDHVFLCGNPEMVDDLIGLLEPMGYHIHSRHHPGNLHVEKFW